MSSNNSDPVPPKTEPHDASFLATLPPSGSPGAGDDPPQPALPSSPSPPPYDGCVPHEPLHHREAEPDDASFPEALPPSGSHGAADDPPQPALPSSPPPPPYDGGVPHEPLHHRAESDATFPEALPPSGYPGAGDDPPQPALPSSPPPPPYDEGVPQEQLHHRDGYGSTDFGEESAVKESVFSDNSIRRGFIRKVFAILTCQLGVTMAIIAWFMYDDDTRVDMQCKPLWLLLAIVLVIVSLIVMKHCDELRRKAPMNFIFLAIFTLTMAFLLAVLASRYEWDEVLMATGITAAVCLALTVFTFQTKYDFAKCGSILFVALVILIIFGIVALFASDIIEQIVYPSFSALIFTIYLLCDTQMMMGEKHKYSISPEEYIFAVLNLYLDIINIFMYIMCVKRASHK